VTSYWICASFTLVSALVSLGYSAAALRVPDRDEAGPATHYAFVRSVTLAVVALVPLLGARHDWLIAIATAMVLVQAGDAVVGAMTRDRFKTLGPAATALVNLGLLTWFAAA
jgi:hypothetical protein